MINVDVNYCALVGDYSKAGLKYSGSINVFSNIFSTRSPKEITLINDYYKQRAGHDLFVAIDKEFSKDAKKLQLNLTHLPFSLILEASECSLLFIIIIFIHNIYIHILNLIF